MKRYTRLIRLLASGAATLLAALCFTACGNTGTQLKAQRRIRLTSETVSASSEEFTTSINEPYSLNVTGEGITPVTRFVWSRRFMTELISDAETNEWFGSMFTSDSNPEPTNYIDLTVSEDTQSAQAECLGAFAVPIEIKVALADDETVCDTVQSQYAMRLYQSLILNNGYEENWGEVSYTVTHNGDLYGSIARAHYPEEIYLTPQTVWDIITIRSIYCAYYPGVYEAEIFSVKLDDVEIDKSKALSEYGFTAGNTLHTLKVTFELYGGTQKTFTFKKVSIVMGASE